MLPTTTFDSTKRPLLDLLQEISRGQIQLPDFQRGWIWDDAHLASLLASISMSYPIGAVMLLETGNVDVKFKPRLVEGVSAKTNRARPEQLILDGQQRLTSLFQALSSGDVVRTRDIRGNEVERWYYVEIAKALINDREESVVGVPGSRIVRGFGKQILLDISTPENEFKQGYFPLAKVFDCADWRAGYSEYWDYDKAKLRMWDAFEKDVIKRFEQYLIPVIALKKETPKDAVCQVFEKVNTGGVSLTVFELLTAAFAADDFNLREDWDARAAALSKHNVLQDLENTDFLQAVSLLATREKRNAAINRNAKPDDAPGISCKRKDILKLTLDDYRQWADAVMGGFDKAAKFLFSQKIFAGRDLPYRTQLVPLAAIYAALPKELKTDSTKNKITRWFWSGVFGELYGGAIESRFAKDLPEVLRWLDGAAEPDTVKEATFAASRLHSLRTRNSAAYKGLSALLMSGGGQDFLTGDPIDLQLYFDEEVDIHHIFPQKWCEENDVRPKLMDCVVNKTPLSARTNRVIGGSAPSRYLAKLEKKAGISTRRMAEILGSHHIDAEALREDDFDEFFEARTAKLVTIIENAMGKPVIQDLATAKEA